MQKKFKKAILKIFIISIVLSQISLVYAFAENIKLPSNVELIGTAEGMVLIPGEERFLESLNMLPGDSVSRQLVIKNKYSSEYEIYVRAERVSTADEFDLLSKLQLNVDYDGRTIYEGSANGEKVEGAMTSNISLGTLKPGEEKILNAKVVLPGELVGNDYKNKEAEVNWIFTAIRKENVVPPVEPEIPPVEPEEPAKEDLDIKPSIKPTLPQTGQDFGSMAVQLTLAGIIIVGGSRLLKK